MIKFKRFNPDNLKTDIYGMYPYVDILFIDKLGVVRAGTLMSDWNHNNVCNFHVSTHNGTFNIQIGDLYCEAEIEEND